MENCVTGQIDDSKIVTQSSKIGEMLAIIENQEMLGIRAHH